ncbi:MAG: E2 ligase fold family C protein [Planctomycetota bacterium]
MALAPYFDKAALGAHAYLRGVQPDDFARILNDHVIALEFDESATCGGEGAWTTELAINLLARLYPRIAVVPQGAATRAHADWLRSLALKVNPRVEFCDAKAATVALAVGSSPTVTTARVVYAGSDGWMVRVSPVKPMGSGSGSNPFGAAAAACFGAANVFRTVFAEHLDDDGLDDFEISVLDLSVGESGSIESLEGVSIGEVHLVGAGAIGNGAIWVLSRLPGLRGKLHIVDPELVELHNVQRYVLTAAESTGIAKTMLARTALQDQPIDVLLHDKSWGEFLAGHDGYPTLDRVAVAVDTAADRIAIQASLPRWIANAWTQPGDVGVSRHGFLDGACLACLYMPDEVSRSEGEIVAEAIGLLDHVKAVEHLLYTGAPVGDDFVRQIAAGCNLDPESLLSFSGQSLREFYTEVVCGGVLLSFGAATEVEVPLVFQSCLAGIMLAACVVADSLGNGLSVGSKSTVDLLRPVRHHVTVPLAKHRLGRCLCQDADYRKVWIATHGAGSDPRGGPEPHPSC